MNKEHMKETYFIGDHHFGHINIIEYENRPFDSVQEMNEYMIDAWNTTITNTQAKVFHLGDFALSNAGNIENIVSQLNGNIYLIKGNHDHQMSNKRFRELGFHDVYDYPILYGDKILLSHNPKSICTAIKNLHGHLHSKESVDSNCFNVSVEQLDYKPISLYDIMEITKWKI